MASEQHNNNDTSQNSLLHELQESLMENETTTNETTQEKLIENELTPFSLQFWKPNNIMSVEDTPFSNRFLVTLLVIAFSIPGNLARISLQKLTQYENAYLNYQPGTVVWVNFAACFIMSWCNNAVLFWSLILKDSKKSNMKQLALHTGITSGFCGTFSTLSSAMIELFFSSLDMFNGKLHNNGYRVMQFFSTFIITFAVPILGHVLGKHFAVFFDWFIVPKLAKILTYRNIRVFELIFSLLGIFAIIANIVLSCTLDLSYWYKRTYSFSILMGALGTVLRFKLSVLNGRFIKEWFPTGTLIANIVGCLIIAILQLLINGLNVNKRLLITNTTHQFILFGFSTGFCGSLTTMSSLVNELYNLQNPLFQHAYFWCTFAICFSLILIIDGSYIWTVGFQN